MNKEKLGQEPAFPSENVSDGMSKRFYAACAAMQGMIAPSDYNLEILNAKEDIARHSFLLADELLKQENL